MKPSLFAALVCSLTTIGVSHANTFNSCSFDPAELTIPYNGFAQTSLSYDVTVDANMEMCLWLNGVLEECSDDFEFPPSPYNFGVPWGEVQALGISSYGYGTSSEELCSVQFTLEQPSIPTLSAWGTSGLALLMAGAALFALRRRTI